jgi:hypothetical protein
MLLPSCIRHSRKTGSVNVRDLPAWWAIGQHGMKGMKYPMDSCDHSLSFNRESILIMTALLKGFGIILKIRGFALGPNLLSIGKSLPQQTLHVSGVITNPIDDFAKLSVIMKA